MLGDGRFKLKTNYLEDMGIRRNSPMTNRQWTGRAYF